MLWLVCVTSSCDVTRARPHTCTVDATSCKKKESSVYEYNSFVIYRN